MAEARSSLNQDVLDGVEYLPRLGHIRRVVHGDAGALDGVQALLHQDVLEFLGDVHSIVEHVKGAHARSIVRRTIPSHKWMVNEMRMLRLGLVQMSMEAPKYLSSRTRVISQRGATCFQGRGWRHNNAHALQGMVSSHCFSAATVIVSAIIHWFCAMWLLDRPEGGYLFSRTRAAT